jgi:hypothetical protein
MIKLFLPVVFFIAFCANSLAQTSSTIEVLYVAGPQGTSSVSLHTYNVNSQTAVATQVGSAIPVHNGSIDPLTIGTTHYIYLWNSKGVWLYPTNANGVPTSTPSQHLTFSFVHPVYSFLVDPNGKFAYAAMVWTDSQANNDASIVLFTIDQSTGKLTNTNQVVASYSHAYIGFIKFLFGTQGGKLFAEYLDDGPHTTIFGYDYYPVNQTTGQLGKLQSMFYAQTGECQTSCKVAVTGALSAQDGVCCGPGSGNLGVTRTSTGQTIGCQSSMTFCQDDVANLDIDPANANVFFGDATINLTYIGNLNFSTSQISASPSTIPGTPPVYFSPDSRLVYAVNSNDIGIYAFHTSTGILGAGTTLPDSGAVNIATATLHN